MNRALLILLTVLASCSPTVKCPSSPKFATGPVPETLVLILNPALQADAVFLRTTCEPGGIVIAVFGETIYGETHVYPLGKRRGIVTENQLRAFYERLYPGRKIAIAVTRPPVMA